MIVFVGGIASGGITSAPAVIEDVVASTLIGCRAGSNYLDGTMDDLRIYSRALDSSEIATLANSITLTPGTIAVQIDNDELLVHALEADSIGDLADGRMAARVIHFEQVAGRRA